MTALNIFIRFMSDYWKEVAIGIVCGTLFYISASWWKQEAEIRGLRDQLGLMVNENAELHDKVNAYKKAETDLQAAIEASDRNRQKIISVFQKEINSIRTQNIPKDCEGAINYGIKMKGDLQWPKAD
jgi:membrane-associated HD superfamily phosphohydrolase